jgi:hypothetical protein
MPKLRLLRVLEVLRVLGVMRVIRGAVLIWDAAIALRGWGLGNNRSMKVLEIGESSLFSTRDMGSQLLGMSVGLGAVWILIRAHGLALPRVILSIKVGCTDLIVRDAR